MPFRDAFARADIRPRSAWRPKVVPGSMLKYFCIGMTAVVCLAVASAAEAADLSMTPIYQARPSAAAARNDSAKDESRPAGVPQGERFKLSPGTGALTRTDVPLGGRLFWTGVYDRF
jgi:hypothetical protein